MNTPGSQPNRHGELPYDGAPLHPQEVELVKNNYDIVLYTGNHGFGEDEIDTTDVAQLVWRPTGMEYYAVSEAIDSMPPCSVVFIEGTGHLLPPLTPLEDLTATQAALELALNHKIDAWEFAHRLATSKGIEVQFGDLDFFEAARLALSLGITSAQAFELNPANDPSGLFPTVSLQRCRADARRNADHALQTIAARDQDNTVDMLSQQAKPQLASFYGRKHLYDLMQAFNELGLPYTVQELPHIGYEQRVVECVGDVALRAARQIIDHYF